MSLFKSVEHLLDLLVGGDFAALLGAIPLATIRVTSVATAMTGIIAAARKVVLGKSTVRCSSTTNTMDPIAQLAADAMTVPIGPNHFIKISLKATLHRTQTTM